MLIDRLSSLAETGPANSAALVIGAGTLPFTLDLLPPTVVIADLHQSVIDTVTNRCKTVARIDSWEDYEANFPSAYGELVSMRRAGLVRDFEPVRLATQRARIVPVVGNVISTAPGIFNSEDMLGKTLTFINFTNIAQYLRHTGNTGPQQGGRAMLAALLSELPVCEQTVICDSSFSQQVALYTPDEYSKFGAWSCFCQK